MRDAEARAVLAKGLTTRRPVPGAVRGPERRRRRGRASGRGSLQKGREAESAVVAMWRRHGHPEARRQPGSGNWRPYGAGDVPEMPADVGGVAGWLQEVKWDKEEAVAERGSRYRGGRFIRQTLHELDALWRRVRIPRADERWNLEPVAWIRGPKPRGGHEEDAWRVFVRAEYFGQRMGGWSLLEIDAWVEVPARLFFAELARR